MSCLSLPDIRGASGEKSSPFGKVAHSRLCFSFGLPSTEDGDAEKENQRRNAIALQHYSSVAAEKGKYGALDPSQFVIHVELVESRS
jgi:hypothetical protein